MRVRLWQATVAGGFVGLVIGILQYVPASTCTGYGGYAATPCNSHHRVCDSRGHI